MDSARMSEKAPPPREPRPFPSPPGFNYPEMLTKLRQGVKVSSVVSAISVREKPFFSPGGYTTRDFLLAFFYVKFIMIGES
jgi:hypothetical protein